MIFFTKALEVHECLVKTPLKVLCGFILFNLQKVKKIILVFKTSNAILSFISFTKIPSTMVIRVSSLLIWFIGQTRPTSYFLHGSLSMNMTFNSWAQLMWMGIFLTKSWFPFFQKWNSMKVFGSKAWPPKLLCLERDPHILSFILRYKLFRPKYSSISFFNNGGVYWHIIIHVYFEHHSATFLARNFFFSIVS